MFYTRKDREKDREAFLEAIRLITGTMERQLEVVRTQLAAHGDYMRMLSGGEAPMSRTLRDEDEFEMEVERERAAMRWHGEES
jgi:hypothetical protein